MKYYEYILDAIYFDYTKLLFADGAKVRMMQIALMTDFKDYIFNNIQASLQ